MEWGVHLSRLGPPSAPPFYTWLIDTVSDGGAFKPERHKESVLPQESFLA